MKVLVLGGDGMLGHQVARALSNTSDVIATVRTSPTPQAVAALVGSRIIANLDVRVPGAITGLLVAEQPQVVINTVGIVKQRAAATDPIESITVNSLFPHHLATACRRAGARLIHISTDCVFSGSRGDYVESDNPDPVDLYGRTKLLGEVADLGCLTIRTSIIGLELSHYNSLIEWFLRQRGNISGFTRAMWSGVTTAELSRVIGMIIKRHPELHGVWHVSGPMISKHDLLVRIATLLGSEVTVVPDDSVVVDRSLNSHRFRAEVNYEPPSWQMMLSELATEAREREGYRAV